MHANKQIKSWSPKQIKGKTFTGPQEGLGLLFNLAVPPLDTAEAFAGVANDSALFIPVQSQNSY